MDPSCCLPGPIKASTFHVGNFEVFARYLKLNLKLQPLSKFTAISPWSVAVASLCRFAVSLDCWLFFSSSQPINTLPIVRPANDNLSILPFNQSNKVLACDCHCFNNCLISKVCAQISNSLSYTQISKRPSAAIILYNIISYHITLYHITLHYIISYYIISYYITLYYIILYYIILYNIILHYIILHYIILYYIILHYIISYIIILYCIISYYITLYHIVLYHIIL